MINYMSDAMNELGGLPPFGPRFPQRPRPVNTGGVKLNNISVSNSVVGTINTGSIGSVDQSISALVQLGEPALAEAIKSLSEAILQSEDLTSNQREELVEILSVLAMEAATPKERRRGSVVQTLLDKAMKIASLTNDITDVCQRWWPVLHAAFGIATGG
jgi:ABC-type transporter Mla subunit MlaD